MLKVGREWRGFTSSRIDDETYLALLRRGGTEIKRSGGTFAAALHGIPGAGPGLL